MTGHEEAQTRRKAVFEMEGIVLNSTQSPGFTEAKI